MNKVGIGLGAVALLAAGVGIVAYCVKNDVFHRLIFGW